MSCLCPCAEHSATLLRSRPIVRAVTKIEPPFVNDCALTDPHCEFPGINIEIFRLLMATLGYSYKLSLADDNTSGYQLRSGGWGGMIGQLDRAEQDMTATLTTIRIDRGRVVNYSLPVTKIMYAFLIRRPEQGAGRSAPTFMLTPLSNDVWFALIGGWTIIAICSCLLNRGFKRTERLEQKLAVKKGEEAIPQPRYAFRLAEFLDLYECLFEAGRIILRQNNIASHYCPMSTLLLLWDLVVFFVVSAYGAALTSALVVSPRIDDPFEGIDELSKYVWDKKYTMITDDSPMKYEPLYNKTDPENYDERLRIAYQWNPPVFATSSDDILDSIISNGSLVYYGSLNRILDMSSHSCQVKVVEDRFAPPRWLGFAFRRKTPLRELTDIALFTDSVHEFVKKLYIKYSNQTGSCDGDHKFVKASADYSQLQPLGIFEMQEAVLVLGAGLFISSLVCIAERTVGSLCRVNLYNTNRH